MISMIQVIFMIFFFNHTNQETNRGKKNVEINRMIK